MLDKLVDEWHPNENITKHIVAQFEKNLDKFTQHKVSTFDGNIQCPFCKNNNILISKRNTLVNYPVDWLKIEIDSIQDL